YVWDATAEKLVRRRVTLSDSSAKKRYARGKEIKKDIDEMLLKGAVINRPENQRKKSEILTVSETTKLPEAIDYFISFTESTLKPRTHETYETDLNRFKAFLDKR